MQRDFHHPYWGGYLDNIENFDAAFFGISPREAMRMDPQQRILLEVFYEAMLDAGFTKESLAGSNTGIFAGIYPSQLGHLQALESDLDALYIPTGNATSIAANRLSYLFDLRGPNLVIDTACSASLVATHLACLHLQSKLCDVAFVSGVQINILPSMNLLLAKSKMLSPDGQCKTFDASANGYVPGEGVGVVALKPLSKALQDNNKIYAVILGSGTNQDGKTNGLTAPNGLQQENLLKTIYQEAAINPHDISYIECHGTGTFLGDPIEMQAIGEVVGKNRDAKNPCWVGSLKANLGHLEPAAGIASLIKVALSLQHQEIPPQVNYSKPNPHIYFDKYHLQVPKHLVDWPIYGKYRMCGVSGFGFGGTNAHVLLREAVDHEKNTNLQETNPPMWQHKRYWPPLKRSVNHAVADLHPFQAAKIISSASAIQFEFQFDTKSLPEIQDTAHVLHAGYYLEMLAFAIQEHFQKKFFYPRKFKILISFICASQ